MSTNPDFIPGNAYERSGPFYTEPKNICQNDFDNEKTSDIGISAFIDGLTNKVVRPIWKL